MTLHTLRLCLVFATGVNIVSACGSSGNSDSSTVADAEQAGAPAGGSSATKTGSASGGAAGSRTTPSAGGSGTAGANAAAGNAATSTAGSAGSAASAGSAGPSGAAGSGGMVAAAGSGEAGAGADAAAGSGGQTGAAGAGADATDAQCPVVVADADCDKSQRPFVFVHGTYGSGDNITHVADLFGSNGYCQDRFVAVEYNSVGFGANTDPLIDAVVDEVLKKTGQDKVDIACHSQGTYQCTNYMGDATRAAKIAHYINLSGGVTVPNNVESLSLSSDNDLGGSPAHATNAGQRVTFMGLDHMAVAASTEAFVEMWKYLHDGQEPKYKTVQCGEDPVTIESLVETFADNKAIANAKVEAFEITASAREHGAAAATQMSDAQGKVPAFTLKRNVQYELQASDSSGKPIARVYFSPFKRSNRLVRFLAPSGDSSVVSSSTGMVATGEGFSAVSARYLGGALRHDMNELLTVNAGTDVLTDMTAGRTQVTVGLYLSDQNKNGMSDYGQSFTSNFLAGTDVFLDAKTPAFLDFKWKDPFGVETELKVPNWPSTEGILLVMLP